MMAHGKLFIALVVYVIFINERLSTHAFHENNFDMNSNHLTPQQVHASQEPESGEFLKKLSDMHLGKNPPQERVPRELNPPHVNNELPHDDDIDSSPNPLLLQYSANNDFPLSHQDSLSRSLINANMNRWNGYPPTAMDSLHPYLPLRDLSPYPNYKDFPSYYQALAFPPPYQNWLKFPLPLGMEVYPGSPGIRPSDMVQDYTMNEYLGNEARDSAHIDELRDKILSQYDDSNGNEARDDDIKFPLNHLGDRFRNIRYHPRSDLSQTDDSAHSGMNQSIHYSAVNTLTAESQGQKADVGGPSKPIHTSSSVTKDAMHNLAEHWTETVFPDDHEENADFRYLSHPSISTVPPYTMLEPNDIQMPNNYMVTNRLIHPYSLTVPNMPNYWQFSNINFMELYKSMLSPYAQALRNYATLPGRFGITNYVQFPNAKMTDEPLFQSYPQSYAYGSVDSFSSGRIRTVLDILSILNTPRNTILFIDKDGDDMFTLQERFPLNDLMHAFPSTFTPPTTENSFPTTQYLASKNMLLSRLRDEQLAADLQRYLNTLAATGLRRNRNLFEYQRKSDQTLLKGLFDETNGENLPIQGGISDSHRDDFLDEQFNSRGPVWNHMLAQNLANELHHYQKESSHLRTDTENIISPRASLESPTLPEDEILGEETNLVSNRVLPAMLSSNSEVMDEHHSLGPLPFASLNPAAPYYLGSSNIYPAQKQSILAAQRFQKLADNYKHLQTLKSQTSNLEDELFSEEVQRPQVEAMDVQRLISSPDDQDESQSSQLYTNSLILQLLLSSNLGGRFYPPAIEEFDESFAPYQRNGAPQSVRLAIGLNAQQQLYAPYAFYKPNMPSMDSNVESRLEDVDEQPVDLGTHPQWHPAYSYDSPRVDETYVDPDDSSGTFQQLLVKYQLQNQLLQLWPNLLSYPMGKALQTENLNPASVSSIMENPDNLRDSIEDGQNTVAPYFDEDSELVVPSYHNWEDDTTVVKHYVNRLREMLQEQMQRMTERERYSNMNPLHNYKQTDALSDLLKGSKLFNYQKLFQTSGNLDQNNHELLDQTRDEALGLESENLKQYRHEWPVPAESLEDNQNEGPSTTESVEHSDNNWAVSSENLEQFRDKWLGSSESLEHLRKEWPDSYENLENFPNELAIPAEHLEPYRDEWPASLEDLRNARHEWLAPAQTLGYFPNERRAPSETQDHYDDQQLLTSIHGLNSVSFTNPSLFLNKMAPTSAASPEPSNISPLLPSKPDLVSYVDEYDNSMHRLGYSHPTTQTISKDLPITEENLSPPSKEQLLSLWFSNYRDLHRYNSLYENEDIDTDMSSSGFGKLQQSPESHLQNPKSNFFGLNNPNLESYSENPSSVEVIANEIDDVDDSNTNLLQNSVGSSQREILDEISTKVNPYWMLNFIYSHQQLQHSSAIQDMLDEMPNYEREVLPGPIQRHPLSSYPPGEIGPLVRSSVTQNPSYPTLSPMFGNVDFDDEMYVNPWTTAYMFNSAKNDASDDLGERLSPIQSNVQEYRGVPMLPAYTPYPLLGFLELSLRTRGLPYAAAYWRSPLNYDRDTLMLKQILNSDKESYRQTQSHALDDESVSTDPYMQNFLYEYRVKYPSVSNDAWVNSNSDFKPTDYNPKLSSNSFQHPVHSGFPNVIHEEDTSSKETSEKKQNAVSSESLATSEEDKRETDVQCDECNSMTINNNNLNIYNIITSREVPPNVRGHHTLTSQHGRF